MQVHRHCPYVPTVGHGLHVPRRRRHCVRARRPARTRGSRRPGAQAARWVRCRTLVRQLERAPGQDIADRPQGRVLWSLVLVRQGDTFPAFPTVFRAGLSTVRHIFASNICDLVTIQYRTYIVPSVPYMLPPVLLAKPAVKTLQEHLMLLERANAAGVLVSHAYQRVDSGSGAIPCVPYLCRMRRSASGTHVSSVAQRGARCWPLCNGTVWTKRTLDLLSSGTSHMRSSERYGITHILPSVPPGCGGVPQALRPHVLRCAQQDTQPGPLLPLCVAHGAAQAAARHIQVRVLQFAAKWGVGECPGWRLLAYLACKHTVTAHRFQTVRFTATHARSPTWALRLVCDRTHAFVTQVHRTMRTSV